MTHLSLFSGIGGIDLAAHWAGFKTIAFVERDPFCQKVLAKHWPEVPIFGDITTFRGDSLAHSSDLQCDGGNSQPGCKVSEPRNNSRSLVHLLSGGFPCQPFSVAGKRKGTGDPRFLWDEMLRVIREVQPLWVLGENVRGLLSIDGGRTFGAIIHDLAQVGYRVGWGVYGACHVGAPHRRERVFIVAHSKSQQDRRSFKRGLAPDTGADGQDVPHSASVRRQRRSRRELGGEAQEGGLPQLGPGSGWATEPAVGRVVNGTANRVDRLRALGNAVVPQQVYPILKAIADEIRGVA
jgi:DNA (cytosine-5)-methyltransferase 1